MRNKFSCQWPAAWLPTSRRPSLCSLTPALPACTPATPTLRPSILCFVSSNLASPNQKKIVLHFRNASSYLTVQSCAIFHSKLSWNILLSEIDISLILNTCIIKIDTFPSMQCTAYNALHTAVFVVYQQWKCRADVINTVCYSSSPVSTDFHCVTFQFAIASSQFTTFHYRPFFSSFTKYVEVGLQSRAKVW